MNIITLDFETFYSDDFTLSKMTTESYIRDSRFEAHGCAIKFRPDLPAKWWNGNELKELFAQVDWSTQAVLAHHSQFDGLILSHQYGVKPKFWFDTLSMARLVVGNHLSVSLENLAKHFNLAAKNVPYNLFKGKHWNELDSSTQALVAAGSCHDVELTYQLFKILAKDFPQSEYEVTDATIKMFTDPCLRGDLNLLNQVWMKEATTKQNRLEVLNVTEADLQSSDRFAQLLRDEGVEPDTKQGPVSTKTGNSKENYCFAKTDQFMRDLLEDDDDRIRMLAEARLGAKSTLMQTRAETLGGMGSRGSMCVYLRMYGAHTTRWSGGDGANWQNFKRGSDIRRAIMAPEGYLLAPIDLSQIECRILNYLAGQEDVIEKFRNGEDPYVGIASQAYGFQVTKEHPKERGTGKQLELSCGYQAGAKTIQNTARLGIYGPPVSIDLDTATQWRDLYRNTHPQVTAYWKTASRMISRIAGGEPLKWGPMLIKEGKIFGPGGTWLNYTTLEYHVDPETGDKNWRYKQRNGWSKLYSGKLVENVVQWLARIVMSDAMIRLARQGYRVVNCTHDELLILLKKDGNEQQVFENAVNELRTTPTWLPGLPLDAEGVLSERYSK